MHQIIPIVVVTYHIHGTSFMRYNRLYLNCFASKIVFVGMSYRVVESDTISLKPYLVDMHVG